MPAENPKAESEDSTKEEKKGRFRRFVASYFKKDADQIREKEKERGEPIPTDEEQASREKAAKEMGKIRMNRIKGFAKIGLIGLPAGLAVLAIGTLAFPFVLMQKMDQLLSKDYIAGIKMWDK